jgi:hypothetical protein
MKTKLMIQMHKRSRPRWGVDFVAIHRLVQGANSISQRVQVGGKHDLLQLFNSDFHSHLLKRDVIVERGNVVVALCGGAVRGRLLVWPLLSVV